MDQDQDGALTSLKPACAGHIGAQAAVGSPDDAGAVDRFSGGAS
jgi:hypothetical protein